jgi:hypothetical protein
MSSSRRSSTARLAIARLGLGLGLAVAALTAAPSAARAQTGGAAVTADPGARAALFAERQRVRVDLEQANAEIDALKRSTRGVRDDYRLRARMADAEALARRLTALDARLGAGALPTPAWSNASPQLLVLPTDGPAELEAKADILADQARRLSERGDALLSRARDLRARQNLRRRVGQMERDPFSPLEGSKRRAMASGTTTALGREGNGPPPPSGSSAGTGSGPGQTFTSDTKAPTAPAIDSTSGAPTAPPATVGTATPGPRTVSAPIPTSSSTGGLALSAQLRDLLDPTTLAEVQRLEATGGAANGFEALERAAAALKTRAQRLNEQAAAVRAKAH